MPGISNSPNIDNRIYTFIQNRDTLKICQTFKQFDVMIQADTFPRRIQRNAGIMPKDNRQIRMISDSMLTMCPHSLSPSQCCHLRRFPSNFEVFLFKLIFFHEFSKIQFFQWVLTTLAELTKPRSLFRHE